MNVSNAYTALNNGNLNKEYIKGGVLSKPQKKMKKRRQLDALIGNDKKFLRRKQTSCSGGAELLRSNDSESSEVEEFSIIEPHELDKRCSCPRFGDTCCAVTRILVMSSFLVACVTLFWMHIELRKHFYQLTDRINIVEQHSADARDKLSTLQSKLIQVNSTVYDLKLGRYGLDAVNSSIAGLKRQITLLTSESSLLRKKIASADSKNKDGFGIEDVVASIGSGVQTAQADVEQLRTSQKGFSTRLDNLSSRILQIENMNKTHMEMKSSSANGIEALLSEMNISVRQEVQATTDELNKMQKNPSHTMVPPGDNISISTSHATDVPVARVNYLLNQLLLSGAANWTSQSPGNASSLNLFCDKNCDDLAAFMAEVVQNYTVLNVSLHHFNETIIALNDEVHHLLRTMHNSTLPLSNETQQSRREVRLPRGVNRSLPLEHITKRTLRSTEGGGQQPSPLTFGRGENNSMKSLLDMFYEADST